MSDGRMMGAVAAWLVVACAVAARAQCPSGCRCDADDLLRLTCGAQEVKARDDGYLEVICHGTELNCSALPQLSVGREATLQRLEITQCSLAPAAPLACVLNRGGASGARKLAVQQATSGLSAENVRGMEDLESLFLSFAPGAGTSVPVSAIGALPRLRSARVLSGTVVPLRARMFAPAPALSFLEISMSGIQRIPTDAFQGLGNLTVLSLWGNRIQNVSADAFRGLDSLEQLILNANFPLSSLPVGVLAPTPSLRRLCLERNNLHALDEGVLTGLALLQEIKLQSDVELTLGPRAFSRLPALTSLVLRYSKVPSLPADLFLHTASLVNLTLSNNRIREIPPQLFMNLTALQRLHLNNNRIAAVSRSMFMNLASLTHLDLDGNNIQTLPDRLFGGLTRLTWVSANNNGLVSVSNAAFTGASALRNLRLARNRLAWGQELADYNSPMAPLTDLQTLDLSHNNISVVFLDWRLVLRQLTSLDLSYNAFQYLSLADVQFLGFMNESIITTVDFRNNSIRSVQPRALHTAPPRNLRLLLDRNPFRCDCELYDFIQEVKQSGRYVVTDAAACDQPPSLEGDPLLFLSPEEITCPVPTSPQCRCLIRPALDRTECDCAQLADLPDPAAVGLDRMSLRLRTVPIGLRTVPDNLSAVPDDLRMLPGFVRELNLTGLGLEQVPDVPKTVELLDLTRNEIKTVPKKFFSAKLFLKLAGNPLVCDCWTAEEVTRMQKYSSQIIDYGNVTCSVGSRMARIDAPALCNVYKSAVAGVLFATCVILLAVVAALCYIYWLEIQVFLYSRGWCLHLLPKEDPDLEKIYDVFVSFTHEDEKFVCEEVLPRLEGNYTLHVQDRDWEAGGTIPAEIHRSVEQSRRTLIVLSRSFVRSMWAPEVLRFVHTQAASDKRKRAVVLLVDINKKQLDKETKSFLSLSTLIKYGERMFWGKVIYALPRKNIFDCAYAGEVAYKPAHLWKGGGLDVVLNDQGKLINAAYVKDV